MWAVCSQHTKVTSVPLEHIKYQIMTSTFQLKQLRNIKTMYKSRSNVDNYLHAHHTQAASSTNPETQFRFILFLLSAIKKINHSKKKSPQEKDRLKYQTIPSKNQWSHHKGSWRAHEIHKYDCFWGANLKTACSPHLIVIYRLWQLYQIMFALVWLSFLIKDENTEICRNSKKKIF